MRTPHTSVRQGKRVEIVLRDGKKIYGKFSTRRSRFVELDTGLVPSGGIKSMKIIKGGLTK